MSMKIAVLFLFFSVVVGGFYKNGGESILTNYESSIKSCTPEEFASMLEINDDIVGEWVVESLILDKKANSLTDGDELVGMTLEITDDGDFLFNDVQASIYDFKYVESAWNWGVDYNYSAGAIHEILGEDAILDFSLKDIKYDEIGGFISQNGIFLYNTESFARSGLYNLVRIE